MSRSVVSLTVHKNTQAKRVARSNAALLRAIAKAEHTAGDLAGFAVVTWNRDLGSSCYLHMPTGQPQGRNTVQDFTRAAIQRELTRIEIDD